MKNNIIKIIIFLIIIAVIVVGIKHFYNKQEEARLCPVDESFVTNTTLDNQNIITPRIEVTNEVLSTQNPEIEEATKNMEEHFISIGKWQKFEFNTPVGQDGKFTVHAEKAVQARGFSGASAHIYYLRDGDLYYHNQEDKDEKLASGIIDLKIQGEDIIAIKGEKAIIYVENHYIQYE